MTTSHADHPHPNTSAARAACRKAAAAGVTIKLGKPDETIILPKTAKTTTKAEKVAAANAKRTAAAKAKNPPKPRGECFVCGGKAGWVDKTSQEPVCIKHVDYDNCSILPL